MIFIGSALVHGCTTPTPPLVATELTITLTGALGGNKAMYRATLLRKEALLFVIFTQYTKLRTIKTTSSKFIRLQRLPTS